jgi:YbbR domain-containing protein
MKQILLHNWKIKLTSLLLAFIVWYLIRHNVNPEAEGRSRASADERAKR